MTIAERLVAGPAPARNMDVGTRQTYDTKIVRTGRYEDLPSVECVECRVVFSEPVGRAHRDRTGHRLVKGTLALWD